MPTKQRRPFLDVIQGALLNAAMSAVVFVAEQQLNRRMGRKPGQQVEAESARSERTSGEAPA